MPISVHSIKQIPPSQGVHPLDYLNDQYGESWMYVGRRAYYRRRHMKPSPLANPFRVQASQPRGSCVAQYRHWLWQQIQIAGTNPVLGVLCSLAAWEDDLRLYCWCQQPGPCHAHVIIAAVAWLRSSEGQAFLITRP